jgi:hypothetical protein
MAHANVDVIERALKAFQGGDQDTFVSYLADDLVVHIPGSSVLAGDYKGKQEFLTGVVGRAMELTGGNLSIERHDIVGGDDHVVGIYTWTAKRGDRSLSWRHMNVYHVREGKINEVWWNPFEQAEVDAFFS